MSAQIIRWPFHVRSHSEADLGLHACAICGGGLEDMPTDCPGRPMSPNCRFRVYAGLVDYRAAVGWVLLDCREELSREEYPWL